jgi:hypothetical protein
MATHDMFDDFRRRYPELDNATDRAVGWHTDSTGVPVPYVRDFGTRTHRRMSRKEEEGELAQRRIRRREIEDRAVGFYYRCPNAGCLVAQLWPECLEELPSFAESEDEFVCPSCGTRLEQLGRRAPAVAVLVTLDGAERARLLLEEGIGLDVGRVDAKGCIGLDRHLPADRVGAVSGRHLRLALVGTHVTVADLGSKNGTSIGRAMAPEECRQLPARVPVGWALRDVVMLPGGIVLERSGRRHPQVGERGPDVGKTAPQIAPTVLVRSQPS